MRPLTTTSRYSNDLSFYKHATTVLHISVTCLQKFALDYLQEHIGSTNSLNVYCTQQVYKVIGATLPSMSKENVQTIRYKKIHCCRIVIFKFITFCPSSEISSRFVANSQLSTNLIATACDMVVFCIQQQVADEDKARKEAAEWAGEIISSSGEFLSIHLRKQVCTILYFTG